MKRILLLLLPHLVVIGSLMLLVFLVLNEFNPYMGFLSSDVTRWFYLIYALAALSLAITSIIRSRRNKP